MNGRPPRWPAVPLVAALLVVAPQRVDGQIVERPDSGVRWAPSSRAAPLEVSGIVVDVQTGAGVEGAQVYLRDTETGGLTDRQGRFQFFAARPGEYELIAERIGYRTATSDLVLDGRFGIMAQVGTWPEPVQLCLGGDSGVIAEVRALDTGLAPETEVKLTVWADELVDSAARVAPHSDSLHWSRRPRPMGLPPVSDSVLRTLPTILLAGGDLGVDGPFSVQVEAPGYVTWRASEVFLNPRECRLSPLLRVWLVPSEQE